MTRKEIDMNAMFPTVSVWIDEGSGERKYGSNIGFALWHINLGSYVVVFDGIT
jgi:hypothetical protein